MAGAAYTRQHSSAPWKKPTAVHFTLWNPDEIKKGSVCEVSETTSHVEGVPQPNSAHDLRLGVTDYDQTCETCKMELEDCPGHWGNISLAKPMLHLGYLKTVIQALRCVCFHCSLIKLDPNDPKFQEAAQKRRPESRLRMFAKYCSSKGTCDAGHAKMAEADAFGENDGLEVDELYKGCGKPQPTIYHEPRSFNLWIEYKQNNIDSDNVERKQRLNPEDARRILANIRDDQLELLGFTKKNRPEFMILTQYPVAPPAIRPAITMDAVTKTEDHTTYMYNKIIMWNKKLRTAVQQGAADSVVQDFCDQVQYHIVCMMDNEKNGIPKCTVRSGQPIKSIRERLKGKGGRVRSNLMGKRVDFSARTVIGGDSQIGMDEVAMPVSIASNMTFPERVTTFNVEQLTKLVKTGPDTYPGAKFIIRPDGTRINLAFAKGRAELTLQPGYIVERHVLTNDVVLFNRQPTLHRMSMMGHRARVMPFCTFRMNLSATSPYNADFDGDEMNLHVPQSVLTKAELQEFMMVPKNIISPKSNSPVMGIVQDSLLGIHQVTKRSTFLDKQFMMNAVMHIPTMPAEIPIPAIMKPELLWTGKQLFSMVLPPVNFTGKSNEDIDEPDAAFPLADTKVRIEKGNLLYGNIDKKSVGSSENSLIHVIYNEYSPDHARDMINGIQRITAYFLITRGFSVGVEDTVADVATKKKIQDLIQRAHDQVDKLSNEAQEGLQRQPGKTVKETYEAKVNQILNKTREDAGKKAQQSLRRSNAFKVMVLAGSKGSYLNISQITAVVGQQNVGGKRISYGFRKRSLPHFTQDDYGPSSRGFVANSYLEGVTPSEFFFHMSGGREGLIDTACKTAETGYIQRKLIKALEDIYVAYDGTVRDAQQRLVQLLYGEEGYDSTKMESLKPLPLINDSDKDREKTYKHTYEDEGEDWGNDFLEKTVREQVFGDREAPRKMEEEYEQICHDREWLREVFQPHGMVPYVNPMDGIKVPINLRRLLDNAKINFDVDPKGKSDLSPVEVIDGLRSLRGDMVVVRGMEEIHKQRQQNGTRLWNVVLQAFFASKRVVCEYRLNKRAFHWLLGEVRQRYNAALVPPGEMVGCIAAQSIGEPATQMTLNTFHFAGVASKNVTLGVPRLKELINVVKKPKNQGLVIYLAPHLRDSKDEAKKVQTVVEYLTLRQITNKCEIWYDPAITTTVIPEDEDIVAFDWDFSVWNDEEQDEKRRLMKKMSPWVFRLEINSRSFINFNLTMEEIKMNIEKVFPDTFHVEISDTNAEVRVVRLRYVNDNEQTKKENAMIDDEFVWEREEENSVEWLKQEENTILDTVHLRGIVNIKKVYMRKTAKKEGDLRVEYDPVTGKPQEKEEWVLDTDGSNMLRIMGLEEVDYKRTSSNNITEIVTALGIEATRRKLQKELGHVYGAYGIYINARHSSILCDAMCNRGYLMAINRHGINRQEVGPLMRCSYEETVEILVQASAMNEVDHCTGVSAQVLLGQQSMCGTGLHSLIVDEALLRKLAVQPEGALQKERQYEGVAQSQKRPGNDKFLGSESPFGGASVVDQFEGSVVSHLSEVSGVSNTEGWRPQAFSDQPQLSWTPHFTASQSAAQSRALLSGTGGGMRSAGMASGGGGSAGFGSSPSVMSPADASVVSPMYTRTGQRYAGDSPAINSPSAGIFSGTGGLDSGLTSGAQYKGADSPFYSAGLGGTSAADYSGASPSGRVGGGMSPSLSRAGSTYSPSTGGGSLYTPKSAGVSLRSTAYSPATGSTAQKTYSPSMKSSAQTYRPLSPGMGSGLGGSSWGSKALTGTTGANSGGTGASSGPQKSGSGSLLLAPGGTQSQSQQPTARPGLAGQPAAQRSQAAIPALGTQDFERPDLQDEGHQEYDDGKEYTQDYDDDDDPFN
eukprot:TRINITY_DN13530_c0_g1_i1.p1 TRINITY_DN13530_c0_g1~~TRINITY_DN13530_c0_g1_i1.p1  ORF type:complete len:1888 (+),score=754.16 TRINITY_DN13530_c0_g1_i1:83-5746(+)